MDFLSKKSTIMDTEAKPRLETGVVDEGELLSSLVDLSGPPRLRGEFSLKNNLVAGWLVDARAPTAQLRLALFVEGRKVAEFARPEQQTVPTLHPSSYQFSLSWSPALEYFEGPVTLEVVCFDDDRYVLLIVSDDDLAYESSAAKAQLVFEGGTEASSFEAASDNFSTNLSALADTAAIALVGRQEAPTETDDPTPAPDFAEEPPLTASLRVYVDSLGTNHLSGWAWNEQDPQATVDIAVYENETLIAGAQANNLRQDLKNAGVGTGKYGFVVALPTCNHSKISLEARLGTAVEKINISTQVSEITRTTSLPGDAPRAAKFEGHVDRLTRWGASGWAWLPQSPDDALIVEAIHDEKVVGRAVANRMRQDLATHGKGTGRYGFEITFDRFVDNESPPEFRIMAPTDGTIPNEHPLPALSENERTNLVRGGLEDLYAEHAKFTSAGEEYEDFDSSILECVDRSELDLIAFYLPQFHSINENDRFWGRGFTEWRQLARGLPRYRGHYQPRTPRDLGFYTLTDVEPMTRQVAMAKAAGINVFAFYYYWFNRTRILDEPVEIFLRSGLEMKFMLIWANENWTRAWDGSESEVLLKQDYSEGDESALLADWARHFRDKRYFSVDGRPFFVIYNPKLIPRAKETIARWRRVLDAVYDVNPIIFMAQTFGMRDPSEFGLDGALEFPPHKLSDTLPGRSMPDAYSSDFSGRVIQYADFAKVSLAEENSDYELIKTAVPSWDNEARRPNRGLSLEGASPAKYQNWLSGLIKRALDEPRIAGRAGRAIVAINAWNEWAEGAYLEPDVYFGAAYLNATARAVKEAVGATTSIKSRRTILSQSNPAVTVIFPNYNHEKFLRERILSVVQQTIQPTEILFLDDCSQDTSVELAKELLEVSNIPYRIVLNQENSGNVFKQWIKGLREAKSDWIWIAETDDSADPRFLEKLLPLMKREDVLAAYGKISFIDAEGKKSRDLDGYYDGMLTFDWNISNVVSAFNAFQFDFAVKNVIPNASGLVFKRPTLTDAEVDRLYQYKFAGDWYFYALLLRGGKLGYSRDARSYFRVGRTSASRSAFFTERHLAEHRMVIEDLRELYDVSEAAVSAHAKVLAAHFPDKPVSEVRALFVRDEPATVDKALRLCIAAHSFETGGGELLPLALANTLRDLGHHVTYLVMEKERSTSNLRSRLRPDISVVYWVDVQNRFNSFLSEHGIQVFNSHNVSVEYRLFCRGITPGIPYVASLHGGYETVAHLLSGEFSKFLSTTVSKWLFLAEKNVSILTDAGIAPQSFQKSFNAVPEFGGPFVDRDSFLAQHSIARNAFVFVLCSRAIKEKGWREAILATREAARSARRPIRLVLIGDGPELDTLRKEFQDEERAIFMGHVDNPVRYFKCFDAAIFPSYYKGETFPLFVLECFQQGLPVIASEIGEIPRLFEHSDLALPGRLIGLESGAPNFRALVKGIVEMASNAHAMDQMRQAAKIAGQRFDMKKLARFYVDVCRQTVAPGASEIRSAVSLRTLKSAV